MKKEDILAKLPEDARNLIGIQERKDSWILEHPYIKDGNLYANVITAIEGLGGKQTGYFDKAMHYKIPKVAESGVKPDVVKYDKSKPPELGIDSQATYKELGNAIPSEPYDLKLSAEKLGKLCPVLLDKHGRVIDGNHRMKLDPKWPTVTLENIDTPVKRALARIASNFCRRTVDAEELTREITTLIAFGVKPQQIVELTGISRATIYRHMPEHLKDKVKSEAISEGIQKVQQVSRETSNITTQETSKPQVVCEGCHVGTREPVIWHSHQLCPECKIKADLNPEAFERKFKRGRLPPEEKKTKEFKPKESWEQRKAVMTPQHSKMERTQLIKLSNAGKTPETDREYCLLSTKPDFVFPNVFIYLDHKETHKNRKDQDDRLREMLAKKEGKRVVGIEYEGNSQQEEDRVFKEIMEALDRE